MQKDRKNRERACAAIPAYNEEKSIGQIVRDTKKHVDTVFVMDDGSVDNTAKVAEQNGADVIRLSRNRGIGAALQLGYDTVISRGFDYVVQLDADRQHNPKYIPEMLEVARECDMVIASRFLNESHRGYPLVRRLGISFFTLVANLLTHVGITDVTSGYRVYRTESLRKLSRISTKHWAMEQTLEAGKRGFRVKEVSIEMPYRDLGKSQFSPLIYTLYPLRMTWVILKVMLFR